MRELTPAQLGYLAGIVDGEGHIGLIKRAYKPWQSRSRGFYIRPILQVGQAKRVLLEYLIEIIGEGSIVAYGQRGFFNLRFYPGTLRWLLPQLIPHLILKRRQAEIVLEFMDRAGVSFNGREIVPSEWARREMLMGEIKELNVKPGAKV